MKFKMFLNKVWNFLKKFPVFLLLGIFIPPTIYAGRYFFQTEHYYNNLFYSGNKIDGNPENFEITSINPLFKVTDISSFSNYQGGACYKNYYALCSNNYECLLIYDMNTNKVVHTIYTNAVNTDFHCNTMFFGPDFYKSTDKFPLLYISQENQPSRCTIVCRLFQNGDAYSIEVVQTIYFTSTKEDIYYPNSYFDYETYTLYYSGYTKNSYMRSDDNKIKFFSFTLPDFRLIDVELDASEAEDTFVIDSETATQGGFISHSHLYQTFSFNSKTDPLRAPKMRVVDLQEKKIIKDYQNLGELFGVYEEFEHVAINRNGQMFSLGNPSNIYQFEFKAEQKSH